MAYFRLFIYSFIRPENTIIAVIKTPARTERKTIMAIEASNLQKRKETTTGAAFWVEKIATIVIMINKNTIVIISPP